MAPPRLPDDVVHLIDDDDDEYSTAGSAPSLYKRARAVYAAPSSAGSQDSLDAFATPSPVPKRRGTLVSPIVLDDDTPPSFVPCSLLGARSAVGAAAPGSDLATSDFPSGFDLPSSDFHAGFDLPSSDLRAGFAVSSSTGRATGIFEIPGSPLPASTHPDSLYNEMMGFTTSSLAGQPGPSRVPGTSSPISLDSDEEDVFGDRLPSPKLISPCEDLTLQDQDEDDKEGNPQLIAEGKKKQKRKRLTKEGRDRLNEEKKRQREENKLLKESMKAQKAEQKKYAKEKGDWESGKYALKSIVAEIDSTIIESGSVGGTLLTRFVEKDLKYRIQVNPIRGSILWKMEVPQIGQDPASVSEVPYILFVLQAEEFCDLISSGSFMDHVHTVQSRYPTFTICYVTNKLMNYINKRERSQYRNPSSSNSWKRPPVEEVLCQLATHYVGVHSRQCTDEGEVAEHVVGLTSSLANCKYRKPLTWLSVHANGAMIPKTFIDKDLAKKDTWMKSLIAIPKVQPRFALAIYKKYPTMRSLLNVYMDPSKTGRDKELLLQDLKCENRVGDDGTRVGQVCSKRVYKYLTAQDGTAEADSA
ncbi:crossover junction endonuclease EME1 [Brachypodium distachyon]|uniref:ERCC4 domain-containing protein n=1 Tax=Brachypodium distachyon TaxID=15368 RepID=A0A0Q3GVB8_BRADI|nr:crossover junction endonuclease EME1 [Brachypodium distachyon]KQJ84970.1 hypothetical protein BRADI_5g23976v3 [Brachypodium distachyon]|eukprot:XP_003579390.1 crossover junction endonuclease EME1 [Brachypodium distachyon]